MRRCEMKKSRKSLKELLNLLIFPISPGELYPADIPSRGQSAQDLSVNSILVNGPSFLQEPEEQWLKPQTALEENDQVLC